MRTRILTSRGWLTHDQVRVGDEAIGYNPETGRSNVWQIRLTAPTIGGPSRRSFVTDAGYQDVWCVTTGLGSWTAEQDGQLFLTGNSAGGIAQACYAKQDGNPGVPATCP